MAIAYDSSSSLNSSAWSSGSSFTWSHTCSGSNRFLIVGVFAVSSGGSDIVSGVTYGGTSMTRINTEVSGVDRVYLYGLIAPKTGSNDIVVSLSTSSSFVASGGVSYTGVKQVSQPEANATNSSGPSVSSLSLTVTTSSDNAWLAGIFRNNAVTQSTTNTNCVTRAGYATGGTNIVDTNAAQTPAGSKTMTQTNSSNAGWIGIVAVLAPSISNIKSINGLTYDSVKSFNGLAKASIKNINGLA